MPKICCIDMKQEDIDVIKSKYNDVEIGTLGSKVNMTYSSRYDALPVPLGSSYPDNLHEFDIIIIDLCNYSTIEYDANIVDSFERSGEKKRICVCKYPQTIFDPRPIAMMLLKKDIFNTPKQMIIIVFTSANYIEEYNIARDIDDYHNIEQSKYDLFNLLPRIESISHTGKCISICEETKDTAIGNILLRHLPDVQYNCAFKLPEHYDDKLKKFVLYKGLSPFLKSNVNEIVSYGAFVEDKNYFVLPDFKLKGELVVNLVNSVFPAVVPELFPDSTLYAWLKDEVYFVPNHKELLDKKKALIYEYDEMIRDCDQEIVNNSISYSWLQDLLTGDDDKLKLAVIEYLKYLQFDDVKDMDAEGIKDEDIQIQLGNNLILIETKGVSKCSTDADVMQVTKHLNKRKKHNKNKQVSALYIVNHQKYLEPLTRQTNPFEKRLLELIEDSGLGLITTWQLFLSHRYIEESIFTKTEIRNQLTQESFIIFTPNDKYLGFIVADVYKNKTVATVIISNIEVSVGQEVIVFDDHYMITKRNITSLEQGNKPVASASSGLIGIQCDLTFTKGGLIYFKRS